MAIPVLLILVVLWAAVLLPPLVRARSERHHGDSIGDFNYRLDVIGRTGGHAAPHRAVDAPRVGMRAAPTLLARPLGSSAGMTPTQRRRRDVLLALSGAVLVMLLLAAVIGAPGLWVAQGLADLLLVTYVVLLARVRAVARERQSKVRYLPHPAAPQLALRRSASS